MFIKFKNSKTTLSFQSFDSAGCFKVKFPYEIRVYNKDESRKQKPIFHNCDGYHGSHSIQDDLEITLKNKFSEETRF